MEVLELLMVLPLVLSLLQLEKVSAQQRLLELELSFDVYGQRAVSEMCIC